MSVYLTLFASVLFFGFILLFHRVFQHRLRLLLSIVMSGVIVVTTMAILVVFEPDGFDVPAQAKMEPVTLEMMMEQVQAALTQDPNNGDNWFRLGQLYMSQNDFKSAQTSFDYSVRLATEPTAAKLAGLASAKYYLSSQKMTGEVKELLDRALLLDEYDQTALTLIANDHYLSFEYDDAINVWQRILDSDRVGLNRASIIRSINQSKRLLNKQ